MAVIVLFCSVVLCWLTLCDRRCIRVCSFFFFKQKTAYEMRISDWSSDVCSSDLHIFCTEDQIEAEVTAFHAQAMKVYEDFGFKDVQLKIALRPEPQIGRASCRERVCQYV